jgi:hypothetical protein
MVRIKPKPRARKFMAKIKPKPRVQKIMAKRLEGLKDMSSSTIEKVRPRKAALKTPPKKRRRFKTKLLTLALASGAAYIYTQKGKFQKPDAVS